MLEKDYDELQARMRAGSDALHRAEVVIAGLETGRDPYHNMLHAYELLIQAETSIGDARTKAATMRDLLYPTGRTHGTVNGAAPRAPVVPAAKAGSDKVSSSAARPAGRKA
jgi:hypothetical protein